MFISVTPFSGVPMTHAIQWLKNALSGAQELLQEILGDDEALMHDLSEEEEAEEEADVNEENLDIAIDDISAHLEVLAQGPGPHVSVPQEDGEVACAHGEGEGGEEEETGEECVAARIKKKRRTRVAVCSSLEESGYHGHCTCGCWSAIPHLSEIVNSFEAMTPARLREVVQVMLFTFTKEFLPETASPPGSTPVGKSGRLFSGFIIKGVPVCKKAFLSISGFGKDALDTLKCHLKQTHVIPPVLTTTHVGTGGKESRSTTMAKIFLENFSNEHANASPTGRGGIKEGYVWLLVPDMTKRRVYHIYAASALVLSAPQDLPAMPAKRGHRPGFLVQPGMGPHAKERGAEFELLPPLSFKAFLRVWTEHYPNLIVMKPGSNYCDTCILLKDHPAAREHHRQLARQERTNYITEIAQSQEDTSTYVHFTMDFAEKVYLPHYTVQASSVYFKTRLKFDLFGVSNETETTHNMYCLPEGQWPKGKDVNVVLSMLHHTLTEWHERRGHRTSIRLHADNCAGQNKNQWVMHYLAWRIAVGMDTGACISFMVAGHTRCYCDGAFGLVKRALRTREVHTPAQMVEVVRNCTKDRSIKPIVPSSVDWYDWKGFLGKYFDKSIPQITKHHVFGFSADTIGVMDMCATSTSVEVQSRSLVKQMEQPMTQVSWRETLNELKDFRKQPPGIEPARLTFLREEVFPLAKTVQGTLPEEFERIL